MEETQVQITANIVAQAERQQLPQQKQYQRQQQQPYSQQNAKNIG